MSATKVALVTGGGRGIGAACCRALSDAGFRVAVHYRSSAAEAEELAAKLPDAFPVRADLALPEREQPIEQAGRSTVERGTRQAPRHGTRPERRREQMVGRDDDAHSVLVETAGRRQRPGVVGHREKRWYVPWGACVHLSEWGTSSW